MVEALGIARSTTIPHMEISGSACTGITSHAHGAAVNGYVQANFAPTTSDSYRRSLMMNGAAGLLRLYQLLKWRPTFHLMAGHSASKTRVNALMSPAIRFF
jgi:hypothetical protein